MVTQPRGELCVRGRPGEWLSFVLSDIPVRPDLQQGGVDRPMRCRCSLSWGPWSVENKVMLSREVATEALTMPVQWVCV